MRQLRKILRFPLRFYRGNIHAEIIYGSKILQTEGGMEVFLGKPRRKIENRNAIHPWSPGWPLVGTNPHAYMFEAQPVARKVETRSMKGKTNVGDILRTGFAVS
jgi:hypothetical protein